MTQAIHILRKDVRRLWRQIAFVMVAIGYFASLAFSKQAVVLGVLNGTSLIEPVMIGLVWNLIAALVHEESLNGDNEFWLTRPYRRQSLLAAKVMLAVLVVAVPLFIADCVIIGALSFSVSGNFAGLVLRQFFTAAWLILPPFAIASATRLLTEDLLAWLVTGAVAALAYFPNDDDVLRVAWEKIAIPVAVVLLLAAIWRQYTRRTVWSSRALITAAVLLPAIPFPKPASVALENAIAPVDGAAQSISLSSAVASAEERTQVGFASNPMHCAPISFALAGLRPGWRIEPVAAKSSFETGDVHWTSGWDRVSGWGLYVPKSNASSASGTVNACASNAGVSALAGGGLISARVDLTLAVFSDETITNIPVTFAPFDVPQIGRCVFRTYGSHEIWQLSCYSPVRFPRTGFVEISTGNLWKSPIPKPDNQWMPFGFLPGLSPVYGWTTFAFDAQIREWRAASNKSAEAVPQLTFRPEKRIALLQRQVSVESVRFQTLR